MPFPLSFSGRVEIPTVGPEPLKQVSAQAACDAMALALRARGAHGIEVDGATLRFKSHPWAGLLSGLARLGEILKSPTFDFSSNLLPVVSTGTFAVQEEGGKLHVSYTVRLTYLLLFATVGTAFMAAWMRYGGWSSAFPRTWLPFIPMMWSLGVGINYVASYLRFGKFVQKLASRSP